MTASATIYALSSGHPPAALAIVRLSGSEAFATAAALTGGRLPAPRRAALRRFRAADGALLDEGLLLLFPGPDSATGEDVVELHLHGGRAVVAAVLAALAERPGLRAAAPGEFTRRALANGRLDLTEAEGLADLLAADTEAQRRAAQAMAGGMLRRRIGEWADRLNLLSARAEIALDYVEEEDGAAPPDDLGEDAARLVTEMGALLAAPAAEPLRDGIRVAVAGPPNAGKSSLINALAGSERAIVSPVAGTTRDLVETPLALHGIPFVLIDTAGLRDSTDEIERIGIDRARAAIESADLLLWLGEEAERPPHRHGLLVAAKADEAGPVRPGLLVSAMTREGLSALVDALTTAATSWLPGEDGLVLQQRQRHHLQFAADALHAVVGEGDVLLAAEHLRRARSELAQLSGQASTDSMLDALFGRFCVGK